MSATSEELAAQAEELQSSISFFRVDNAGRSPVVKSATLARPAPVRKPAPSAKTQPAGASIAAQQARVKGFALDLSMGGPDAVDADFKESA
jgi:methyl-accepting chemotaxis protein